MTCSRRCRSKMSATLNTWSSVVDCLGGSAGVHCTSPSVTTGTELFEPLASAACSAAFCSSARFHMAARASPDQPIFSGEMGVRRRLTSTRSHSSSPSGSLTSDTVDPARRDASPANSAKPSSIVCHSCRTSGACPRPRTRTSERRVPSPQVWNERYDASRATYMALGERNVRTAAMASPSGGTKPCCETSSMKGRLGCSRSMTNVDSSTMPCRSGDRRNSSMGPTRSNE